MPFATPLSRAAGWVALVQFFFFTSWIVYAVYLPKLLDQAGIGREWVIWFILLDHLVFAVSDTFMGFAADRFERWIGALGPAIIFVNVASCLAFAMLPIGALAGADSAGLFVGLLLIWLITSSVLRAPPMVLLMKHAARPRAPWLAAIALSGLALGGALSPFLGTYLRTLDPLIPFVVTALTLAATTLALLQVQRATSALPAAEREPAGAYPVGVGRLSLFLTGALLIGFGFQVHFFLNTKAQFLSFIEPRQLELYLPLFWVGFNLMVFPGAYLARRLGPAQVMAMAALLGGLGLIGSALAPSLELLVAAQMLAGGAWGVLLMGGISAALGLGTSGREGLVLGLWFSVLAVATIARTGLVVAGLKTEPGWADALAWFPVAAWVFGALPLALLGWQQRDESRA